MAAVACTPIPIPVYKDAISSVTMAAESAATSRQFALARIKGDVHLVQVSSHVLGTSSALAIVDVNVFRHEFITIFRYSHNDSIHPADIHIIEPIQEEHVLYEEDNGTVFLAKGVMERLRKVTERRPPLPPQRISHYRRRTSS